MKNTYHIRKDRIEEVAKALIALNKKAVKYGMSEFKIKLVNTYTNMITGPCGGVQIPMVELEIEGETPRVGPWEFLAKVDHSPSTGRILWTIPNVMDPDPKFYDGAYGSGCEHCNQKRQRTHLYIVYNTQTGEQKQVGRTCLKDFLGLATIDTVTQRANLVSSVDGFLRNNVSFGAPEKTTAIDLMDVLAEASAAIRSYGWVSKANSTLERPATADLLNWMMSWDDNFSAKTPEDEKVAEKVRDWVLAKTDTENYWINLKTICREGLVYDSRQLALAVSAVGSYQREMKKQADTPKGLVGKPGQRIRKIKATATFSKYLGSGMYGERWINKFVTSDNKELVWFTTYGCSLNEERIISFTVKGHESYKGQESTVVSRVMFND